MRACFERAVAGVLAQQTRQLQEFAVDLFFRLQTLRRGVPDLAVDEVDHDVDVAFEEDFGAAKMVGGHDPVSFMARFARRHQSTLIAHLFLVPDR